MSRRPTCSLRVEHLEDRTVPASLAALGDDNHLLLFDSATPNSTTSVAITGLQSGETLTCLDRWSVNGQLYAIGSRQETQTSPIFGPLLVSFSTYYTINPLSGQATRVSNTASSTAFPGDLPYGPGKVFTTLGTLNVANFLTARVFDGNGIQNEIDTLQPAFYPDILSSSATQGSPGNITNASRLNYSAGDTNFGNTISLVDAAVQPADALPTNMYFLDAQNGVLAKQSMLPYFITPPSAIQTVGSLGVAFDSDGGFDIATDGTAYAALTSAAGTRLYTINLTTGQATAVGTIQGANSVHGLVAIPPGDQNQAPIIHSPSNVLGFEDTWFTYSTANGTSITISDPDTTTGEVYTAEIHSVVFPASYFPNNAAQFTLASTTGLTFTQGDGTSDSHMIFTGTLSAINNALNGLRVKTVYADRFSFSGPESWGQLRVSDTNTTHGGGAALALHEFSIDFQPVDDGAPIAKPYSLTLPEGHDFVRQAVFDNDTFGVDLDELFLLKAKIVSVTQGVHGGQVSFDNAPASQPFWAFVNYSRPEGFVGTDSFTYTITDGSGNFATATITVDVQGDRHALIALGADKGNLPTVRVLDANTMEELSYFQAFDAKFKGGVRVAVGDLNHDDASDIIVAQARDGDGWVRAFTADGQPLAGKWGQGIQPFGKTTQPLEISVGDINGDGYADVAVTGLNKKTPVIRFYDGRTAKLMGERVQPGLKGLFSFTLADLNNDQRADLVAFSSDGKKTSMLAYSGGLGSALAVTNPFDGFENTRRDVTRRFTGLSLVVGNVDVDNRVDIVAAVTTQTGQTYLRANTTSWGSFSGVYQQPTRFIGSNSLNAQLALADINGDGLRDVLLGTSGGMGLAGDLVSYYSSLTDTIFSLPQSNRWYRGFSLAVG